MIEGDDFIDEARQSRHGLWANIHARRKAGKRPKRPDEKGYPKRLDTDEAIEMSLRQLICEELEMMEGIFDGNAGSGRPTPPSPEVLAAAKAKEKEITVKRASLASKKVDAVTKDARKDVDKMSPEEMKKYLEDFSPEASKNKEMSSTAAAITLKMSKQGGPATKDLTDTVKKNPNLRTAINSTPGMADLGNVVDTNLRSVGKDPNKQTGEAWRELGQVASRYGLAK
jgi:hypothetical protein